MADLSSANRIELVGVTKRYDVGGTTVTALDGVSIVIEPGSFVVILGPSGCGKTTLLNMIGALDTPTDGSISVNGERVDGASKTVREKLRRHSVSFVFQTFNLFAGLTARENVRFGADAAGASEGADRTLRALAQVALQDRADHFPHQLSGGEQQRVAIARALATGNPILLADEPTGELDFRTGVQILEVLAAQAAEGMTVLVVTHNREISRIADRVIELSSGKVLSDGPPEGGRSSIEELQW
ncbi:MAG: ABC transporter ATP-binding protein [Actinomycetia bacterium]|nr:ABC transporter ATP-binding protein [Actinomycetes bacterium]